MKNFVRIIGLACIFVTAGITLARNVVVDHGQPLQVARFEREPGGFFVTLNIAQPSWSEVEGSVRQLWAVELPGGGLLAETGMPQVPVAGRLFRLPPGGRAVVEVLDVEYETFTGIDVAAYLGGSDMSGVGSELDGLGPVTKPRDEWYPGNWARVSDPAIMHDFRVATMTAFPVQVNPARHEARIASSLQVRVRFEDGDDRNTLTAQPTSISEAFLPFYRSLLDWSDSDNELDEYTLCRGGVQVIMRDDENLMELMQPWFEWKLQKGWDIELLTDADVDWNNTSIRNELIDRYDEAETPFDYVVIIGDDQGDYPTPGGSGGGYGHGDQPYSLLEGDDNLPDVFVGRISIQNDVQLVTYINKVLNYERDIDPDDADWLLRGLVSAQSGNVGQLAIHSGRYALHAMLDAGFTSVDSAWWNDEMGNVNNRCINLINDGIGYYSTINWVGAGLNITAIMNLHNSIMTPIVVDIGEGTGNWSQSFGTNEAWMLAGTPNSPCGAIGAIGCATTAVRFQYTMPLATGAAHTTFTIRTPSLGSVFFGAELNLYNQINGFDNTALASMLQWTNLMGDPTVWVWTDIPHELEVEADATIELGSNSYTVTVTEDDSPVPDAWVTLYKVDEDEEVIARGVTDADGEALLYTPISYTGDAVLTISKQNCLPYQLEITVSTPDDYIGYEVITFLDNNTQGTEGNSNGIPEAGETVGLVITAINTGENVQTDVSVTASSDDPWVDDIDGTVEFGAIDPGESVVGDDVILLEIAPEAQHNWILHLELEFTSDEGTYADDFPVTVNAPQFVVVDVDYEEFEPGETTDLIVELCNAGGSNAEEAEVSLHSLSPFIRITDGGGSLPAVDIGENGETSTFEVSAVEYVTPGTVVVTRLIITTDPGQVDSVLVPITIGTRMEDDPVGPDRYGYFAYEDIDTTYMFAPTYDWIEINPDADDNDFEGTELDLSDTQTGWGSLTDSAVVVDLPFDVQYYGETFDEITITTNGMAAFGSQADLPWSFNAVIPSPDGPNNMIAPFWDDQRVLESGIFIYHDNENDRFIIEWYLVAGPITRCTFEVVIFDHAGDHITLTGDNEILFQYLDVADEVGNSTIPYASIGIENGDQTDGLQISYWNQPSPGAQSIENESAILFTTNSHYILGAVEGVVSDLATGQPLEGVELYSSFNQYIGITDDEGCFFNGSLLADEYTLRGELECYNTIVTETFEVALEETTTVNIAMAHPEIMLDPLQLQQEVQPGEDVDGELTIINDGNGLLEYSARVCIRDPRDDEAFSDGRNRRSGELDNWWDELQYFELDPNETRNRGVAFFDSHYYISGSYNFDPTGPNKLYKYDLEGELVATFDQPVPEEYRSAQGIYGMTSDGDYLYGVDNGRLFQMQINEDGVDLIDSWEIENVEDIRFITFDSENDLFWMGDINSDIFSVNREGQIVNRLEQDISPRGLGWYPEDDLGYNLYFICRETASFTNSFIRMNPETGDTDLMYEYYIPEEGYAPSGGFISSSWNPLIWVYIAVLDDGPRDAVQVWELSENLSYIEILNPVGTLEGDNEGIINLIFHGLDLPAGEHQFYINFENNACEEENNVVDVTMIIPTAIGDDDPVVQPLEWAFDGAYPNPFNPVLTVRFALKEAVHVQLKIYNLLGQQVAELADRPMSAGRYALPFDGSNLASGMYFLRFDAGPLHETKKVVLLK